MCMYSNHSVSLGLCCINLGCSVVLVPTSGFIGSASKHVSVLERLLDIRVLSAVQHRSCQPNHGLQHHPHRLLCDQAPETLGHLLLDCTLARHTWHEVLAWLRIPAPIPNREPSLMTGGCTPERTRRQSYTRPCDPLHCSCPGWFGSTGTAASSTTRVPHFLH